MGWKEINLAKYAAEVKRNMNITVSDEIIKKDLLLTLILAEFQKLGLGKDLIFKGDTLLSRNYLKYHRFSEDLDFVHKDSNSLRALGRNAREREVRKFLNYFVPELKKVAEALGLDFDTDRSNKKYCKMLSGRTVYTFRVYYTKDQYIKIEINFIEKTINEPQEISISAITDFFDSKKLMSDLNLSYANFKVKSYSIKEIILEKYRAVLTRGKLMERDLFDLYLIENSLNVNIEEVVDKIESSSLIKRELKNTIPEKLMLLKEDSFFNSEEKIASLAIAVYSFESFESFKQKIQPILIEICKQFLQR